MELDNDAFKDNPLHEVVRIMLEWAQESVTLGTLKTGKLKEINGNSIGTVTIDALQASQKWWTQRTNSTWPTHHMRTRYMPIEDDT